MELVSEPIEVDTDSMDARAPAAGAPACPGRFTWRGKRCVVREVLETWKALSPKRSSSRGRYVRRHYFRVLTDAGAEMTLYCLRGPELGKPAWFLYSVSGDVSGF